MFTSSIIRLHGITRGTFSLPRLSSVRLPQPCTSFVARRAFSNWNMASSVRAESLKYLLVLDLEATSGDEVSRHEIIEFPTLVYDLNEDKVQATFHEYVKPVLHPTLTPFCTDLTAITQDVVDKADTFPVVWDRYREFLKAQGAYENPDSYIFLTCGNWDLGTMLPQQLEISECEEGVDEQGKLVPPFNKWINLKVAFSQHAKIRANVGLAGMLRMLKLEAEGRPHSALDDCKNLLRVIQKMREDGWDMDGYLSRVGARRARRD